MKPTFLSGLLLSLPISAAVLAQSGPQTQTPTATSTQTQTTPTTGAHLTPETIFFNGHILTGAHLRPNDPSVTPREVTAIAIARGSVLLAGSDGDVLATKSSATTLIDLGGAFAMPGFNDAHVHLYGAGAQRVLSVDLDHVPSLSAMQDRIRTYTAGIPAGAWVQGAGWDHTLWPGATLPTRTDLDAVTTGHPALFYRTDGHILVANSSALDAAHITANTADPPGGHIDHDSAGNPTGIVREAPAMRLLEQHIPPPSSEQRAHALQAAMDDALAHGVTSVQDFSPDWPNFLFFESLEHTGKLHLRISEWQDVNLPLATLRQRRASHPADDPLLHLGMLKGFMDGSLGSRTAAMEDPYSDDPSTSGIPRYDEDTLNRLSTERAAAGFQLGFHAIGDRANSMALDAFAAAEQTAVPADQPPPPANPDASIVTQSSAPTGHADLRFRVEHAQVLLPADFDRFASLGVIASMQPSHLLTDMKWAGARLGPDRSRTAYAWHSFLDHGVTLAFGTDYPVESIDPFRGLYAAVTRQNEAGTATFNPAEKISIDEAIYAYTQASAFAEFREHRLGRLEPGFLADLVVLDRNPLTASPQQLLHTRVLRTVVNGQTVYTAPSPAAPPVAPAASLAPRTAPLPESQPTLHPAAPVVLGQN